MRSYCHLKVLGLTPESNAGRYTGYYAANTTRETLVHDTEADMMNVLSDATVLRSS